MFESNLFNYFNTNEIKTSNYYFYSKSVSADIQKLSDCLSEEQMERLQRLSQLPAFKQFPQKISVSTF